MESRSPVEANIVATALKLFNESGVEYVGMRELATSLGLRIGNLTYYFPTKDDLVNRLALELAEENNRIIVPLEDVTIEQFFEMLEKVFRNHLKYRCLMLSFVHIMKRNPLVAKRYSKVQTVRNAVWLTNIEALKKSRYISANKKEVEFLVSSIALIARFWISEAAVSFKDTTEDEQIQYYLKMIARIFQPYATEKATPFIEKFLR